MYLQAVRVRVVSQTDAHNALGPGLPGVAGELRLGPTTSDAPRQGQTTTYSETHLKSQATDITGHLDI